MCIDDKIDPETSYVFLNASAVLLQCASLHILRSIMRSTQRTKTESQLPTTKQKHTESFLIVFLMKINIVEAALGSSRAVYHILRMALSAPLSPSNPSHGRPCSLYVLSTLLSSILVLLYLFLVALTFERLRSFDNPEVDSSPPTEEDGEARFERGDSDVGYKRSLMVCLVVNGIVCACLMDMLTVKTGLRAELRELLVGVMGKHSTV